VSNFKFKKENDAESLLAKEAGTYQPTYLPTYLPILKIFLLQSFLVPTWQIVQTCLVPPQRLCLSVSWYLPSKSYRPAYSQVPTPVSVCVCFTVLVPSTYVPTYQNVTGLTQDIDINIKKNSGQVCSQITG